MSQSDDVLDVASKMMLLEETESLSLRQLVRPLPGSRHVVVSDRQPRTYLTTQVANIGLHYESREADLWLDLDRLAKAMNSFNQELGLWVGFQL